MKLTYLVNKKTKTNSLELFGLSRSGKSTYAESLAGGFDLIKNPKNKFALFWNFSKFLFKNPIKTLKLFSILNSNKLSLKSLTFSEKFRIFLMRNSYLLAVLAKTKYLKSNKPTIFDEFLTQSIFIIIQSKSTKKELEKVLSLLNSPCNILLFEELKFVRYKRFAQHRFPGGHINKEYSLEWMKNQEHNYKLIKELLLEKYKKSTF